MEKKMLWLGLMLMVVGLCSSGALATTMGPPAAGLDAGQFGVGLGYSTSDIDIETKELLYTKRRLNEILAKHLGQPVETITRDTERNFYMSAEEAQKYGVIDEIFTERHAK